MPADIASRGNSRFARLRIRPHWRYWHYALVAVGCVLVLVLLAASRTHSRFGVEAVHAVQDSKARVARLDQVLLTMADAETSVRGYLLTKSDIYLETYRESEARIGPLLAEMEKDFAPGALDRDEFEVLKGLIALKREHMARGVASGRLTDPVTPGQAGPGKAFMDQIRLSITVLREHRAAIDDRLIHEYLVRFDDMQNAVTVLALGALGLIIALFGVQQRQTVLRARIAELLEHKNTELESIVEQRTRDLSNLASYLTNAREEERGRLAREMHDELGALLTAAKMDAGWLLRSLGPTTTQDIRDRFKRLIETIGSGITVKRRIIDDLRPPLLQGLGLVEALRALADDFSHEVKVEALLPDPDPAPAEDQALALFRIAQEAFTNIRKYARASNVELGLQLENGELQLWIRDDGTGFDTESPMLNRHGLAGMKHRVQMFGGSLDVISHPGKGCYIEARMPLRPQAS
ncbi:CHASE3 domain-containing protein [Zoogloea sp.]|uniref:sensor histidine kinase n=1 Tax=Zoogloea sp. TaxID=49181 RepID=UPI0031FC2DFA